MKTLNLLTNLFLITFIIFAESVHAQTKSQKRMQIEISAPGLTIAHPAYRGHIVLQFYEMYQMLNQYANIDPSFDTLVYQDYILNHKISLFKGDSTFYVKFTIFDQWRGSSVLMLERDGDNKQFFSPIIEGQFDAELEIPIDKNTSAILFSRLIKMEDGTALRLERYVVYLESAEPSPIEMPFIWTSK